MNLRAIPVMGQPALRRQAKQLYISAFPKEERLPWWILCVNSRRKGIDLTAWLDGDIFCGFTYSVTVADLHFLLFFAVDAELQGRGYGSRILCQLQRTYPQVVLNVEPLLPESANYGQRLRRFAFYKKNGFYDTGYHVWEVGGKFRVLATEQELDVEAYRALFRKLTFGIWNVKVMKDSEK